MDAALLYAETPAMHMHVAALTVLDPATAPGPVDVETYRALVAARLDRLTPFRMRLSTTPFGMDRPVWVEEPDVDLHQHVRAAVLPRPGGPRELAELAGQLLETPLPRDRPLWQMWCVEGLEDGRIALFWKVHHALISGSEAMAVFELVHDRRPDTASVERPGDGADPAVPRDRPPAAWNVAGHAALSLAGTPVRVARTGAEAALSAVRLAGVLTRRRTFAGSLLPFVGPRSALNGALVASRACAFSTLRLSDVKAVKNALGVTVNDVVLAVCGGALRSHLERRGELPRRSLTASVPVTVAGQADAASVLGNTTSVFGATLATDVADPVERLHRIHEATTTAKQLHRALGAGMVLRLADAVPPAVFRLAIDGWSASGLPSRMAPPFNVVVSNLRGPESELYAGGARLVAAHVFGPLVEAISLNITVLSHGDTLDVGVVTSPNLVADPWPIADRIPRALDELVTALPQVGSAHAR